MQRDFAQAFKDIRKEQGLTSKYVFTYSKRTISRVDRAFRGALDRAVIDDSKFCDLRHTFASHLIMGGKPERDSRAFSA